jgi:hypothetical protein
MNAKGTIMTRTAELVLAAALVALGAGTAQAAEFTFEVPVEVSNVPAEVTGVSVSCAALRYSNPSNLLTDPRPQISLMLGRTVTLTGRSFSGTVRIEADAQPGRRPQEANGYECQLAFMTVRDRDVPITNITERYPPAAGTTAVTTVRGLFPAR